jgi:hypothetical protein
MSSESSGSPSGNHDPGFWRSIGVEELGVETLIEEEQVEQVAQSMQKGNGKKVMEPHRDS